MGKGSKTVSNHMFEGINKAIVDDVRKAYIVFFWKSEPFLTFPLLLSNFCAVLPK